MSLVFTSIRKFPIVNPQPSFSSSLKKKSCCQRGLPDSIKKVLAYLTFLSECVLTLQNCTTEPRLLRVTWLTYASPTTLLLPCRQYTCPRHQSDYQSKCATPPNESQLCRCSLPKAFLHHEKFTVRKILTWIHKGIDPVHSLAAIRHELPNKSEGHSWSLKIRLINDGC